MPNAYDQVLSLTSGKLTEAERHVALRDFSSELGWRPSYHLVKAPFVNGVANAHLVVEHGLEPSAVITFLNETVRLTDLSIGEHNQLLGISYNNLVDWHLYVEREQVTYCFNRSKIPNVESAKISRSNFDGLHNQAFDQIVGRKPNANLPNLEDALINTISGWKRRLSADMGYTIPNENLSALFNAILFIRAVEDDSQKNLYSSRGRLLDVWSDLRNNGGNLRDAVKQTLDTLVPNGIPEGLIDEAKLLPFGGLDRSTVSELFQDFYQNKYAPYEYDFSLMSKHALSRIYEHYVSLLWVEESNQASFFPRLPEEERNRAYGSIYTPQFIARFFPRYLREQLPPSIFRKIRTIDPACGSGIFLRTLLEFQCDPAHDGVTSEVISQAFENAVGLDVDENATHATRLSLALLHLTLTGTLPLNLGVVTAESIEYFDNHAELENSFDAVFVNPPFIQLEALTDQMKDRIASYLGTGTKGRIDIYLAFIKLGLEMLKPGGYGFFVLPHNFLISQNAKQMRSKLAAESWIRCLADLSAIRVFQDVGSYIILLIFQKQTTQSQPALPAGIIKCQEYVGHALEDFLEGRKSETKLFSIYEVDQREFQEEDWIILPPTESVIRERLREFPRLSDFAEVRQGFATGADHVFLVDKRTVPAGEEEIFVQVLPDRSMGRYDTPKSTDQRMFYPFLKGRKISISEIETSFPGTYRYLVKHREELEARRTVENGTLPWWMPTRPRLPQNLMRPKIVSPHLVLLPRFSLDIGGTFAVSHGPFIYPKETTANDDLLRVFLAVLNSSVCSWYIATHSHKYAHGYSMLEPKTLKTIPVPNPLNIPSETTRRLVNLVNRRLSDQSDLKAEQEIDSIVADLYGLSPNERDVLGIEV